jgi:hypothetical protein
MINFDFSGQGITQAELDKIEAETNTQFKRFSPGETELEIVHAEHQGPAAKDPSWHKFKLTYSTPGTKATVNAEGKVDCGKEPSVSKWVLVPTTKILYNEENSKRPTAVFAMLRDFMLALGVSVTPENLGQVIPAHFSDVKALIGRKQTAVLGYDGVHIQEQGGSFVLVDKKGNAVNEKTFGSRALAETEAIISGLELKKYLEILVLKPAAIEEAKTNAASSGWDE